MAQEDVVRVLKNIKEGISSKQVHKLIIKGGYNITKGSVTINLGKLVKGGFVIRYYVDAKPVYILKENATKSMKDKVNEFDRIRTWGF